MDNPIGLVDADGVPITYTPTTHRISKAKKGKKVHVCEFGCGKVFTRAEHRKRHEANHRTEPLFKCHLEECEKPFQRADLLARHMERQHGITQTSTPEGPRHRTQSVSSNVTTSSATASRAVESVAAEAQPSILEPTYMAMSPPPTTSMSIGSIIETDPQQGLAHPPTTWNLDYGSTANTEQYSSDSGYSPSSEGVPTNMTVHSYLPRTDRPIVSYASDYQMASLSAQSAFQGTWPDLGSQVQSAQAHIIGFEGQDPSVVGHFPSAIPGDMDTLYGSYHRTVHASVSQPTIGSLANLNSETLQHYDDCYWERVDPLFPVIHHATYMPANAPPFLGTMVLALGAQASPRDGAKAHSVSWFAFASRQLAAIGPNTITDGTLLATLQAIVLFEYFSLYRSRDVGVHQSPQFAALTATLLSSYFHNKPDPAICAKNLSVNPSLEELQQAHQNWVDLESRNKILLSCFILDTQRKTLFDQPPTPAFSVGVPALPSPCLHSAWLTTDFDQWHTFVTALPSQTPTRAVFQSSLTAALSIHTSDPQIFTPIPSLLTPSFQLACATPLSALIVTASDSWLFARKVTLDSWNACKTYLRAWTMTPDAAVATWWAGKILRTYFASQTPGSDPHFTPALTGLELDWCLYLSALVLWAYTTPPSHLSSSSRISSRNTSRSPGPLNRARTLPVTQADSADLNASQTLQLPVRSYGPRRANTTSPALSRSPSSNLSRRGSPYQQSPSPASGSSGASMGAFLARLDTESWRDVGAVRGGGEAESVLVGVRDVLAGKGKGEKGALVGEAARILERLVEGRGAGF